MFGEVDGAFILAYFQQDRRALISSSAGKTTLVFTACWIVFRGEGRLNLSPNGSKVSRLGLRVEELGRARATLGDVRDSVKAEGELQRAGLLLGVMLWIQTG